MHEPRIRYLYLAGTFEERLLLRLIGKYEKARAQIDFMPNTLGVTTDEEHWNTGLVAGLPRGRLCCLDEPTTIRALEQVAQEEIHDAYRDQRDDRAFPKVLIDPRCGTAGGPIRVSAPMRRRRRSQMPLVSAVMPCWGASTCRFVAAAITAETGCTAVGVGHCRCRRIGLAVLMACRVDAGEQVLRVTRNRNRLRDKAGRSLAFSDARIPWCAGPSRACGVSMRRLVTVG